MAPTSEGSVHAVAVEGFAGQYQAVLDEVRDILAAHPETRGRTELLLPCVDCLWCERL